MVSLLSGLNTALYFFLALFLLRLLLRKPWLAAIASLALALTTFTPVDYSQASRIDGAFAVLLYAFLFFFGVRFGFFVLATWVFFGQFVEHAMLTPDLGTWYGQSSLIAIVFVGAISLSAFRTSLGSRPVFAAALDHR